MVLYLGSAMYVPGLALQAIAGIPLPVSCAATGALAAGYTVSGGMRAVIATDILQARSHLAERPHMEHTVHAPGVWR